MVVVKYCQYLSIVVVTLLAESAAGQTLKAAYHGPSSSPGARALEYFQDEVASCTGNNVAVELLLGGSLGQPSEVVSYVSQGEVEMALVPSNALQRYSNEIRFLFAPFAFNNRRHWDTALGDDILGYLSEQLKATADIQLLSYLGGDQFGILSNAPILSAEDIEGRKIRSLGDFNQILASIGAEPTNVAFAELYTAMQTGAVDAAEITAGSVLRTKTFEIFDEFTRTNHRFVTDFLIVNASTLDTFDGRVKDCIISAATQAGRLGREVVVKTENAALEELKGLGVSIHRLTDRQSMFQLASETTDSVAAELGAGTLYKLIAASAQCPNWCDESTCTDNECQLCSFCE